MRGATLQTPRASGLITGFVHQEPPGRLPSVSVVIATRDRPELLRRALAAVLAQHYSGDLECIVVFDQSPHDVSLRSPRVRVVQNARAPGLAGARNTGILASRGDLVAFCDDDDEWLPGKLELQAAQLLSEPTALAATTGIILSMDGKLRERVLDAALIEHADLIHSRISAAHPSTFLFHRQAFERIGLVDEGLPGGYAEDYDLLLRAARLGPIVAVPLPLVTVRWHAASYFTEKWRMISEALGYLLAKHPDFRSDPQGIARVYGQIAFADAAAGNRRAALTAIRRAFGHNSREMRTYCAVLVLARVVSAGRLLRLAHKVGRGI